ncbi:MAG: hypothetical protein DRQ57_10700 [Gammaproteobacteria bacterium]|nr:MAG: hypothetical protein DRQ57_10700 [Gammaproteobacteria bacterium]
MAWLIQNTRLLERQSERYRFRIDLIRHWIYYEFQSGEDVVNKWEHRFLKPVRFDPKSGY